MGHDDIWGAMTSGVVAIILYLILTESFDAVVPENFSNWIVVFFAAGMAVGAHLDGKSKRNATTT